MKEKTYKWMLYLITAVILGVVSIQFYWNYENYQNQKSILYKDIQVALDNSVSEYFEKLAKNKTIKSGLNIDTTGVNRITGIFDAFALNKATKDFIGKDQILTNESNISIEVIMDSLTTTNRSAKILKFDQDVDPRMFGDLVLKVISALEEEDIDVKAIEREMVRELQSRNIDLNYKIAYQNVDSTLTQSSQNVLVSKSSLISSDSQLYIQFDSPGWHIINKIKFGITLSLILILSVLFCLYFLMFTIRKQKKISQMKNDLIGNITHEFKTPIATVTVALEGLRERYADDKKAEKYFDISENQLQKLNLMVEKLLETATLGKDSFNYSYSNFNLNHIITNCYDKASLICTDEFITLNLEKETLNFEGDQLHIENAIENIVDNALKYGGQRIQISSKKKEKTIEIEIEDDGNSLTNEDKDLVFQSFYRKSVGNTHDVKGYGIGLYYSKSIIESHKGSLTLELNPTRFIITLPYEKQ